MSEMKQKLFFFTIGSLLFGFAVFIPYWTGVEAEKQFRQLTQHYPTQDARITLKEATYDRGWIVSSAQSSFEIANNNGTMQRLILSHEIEHGFLPIYPTIVRTIIAPQSDIVEWLHAQESPVQIKTTLRMDGSGDSEIRLISIYLNSFDKPAQLKVQSVTGTLHFTPNFAQITGNFHLPRAELETDKGIVQLNNTILTTNLQTQSYEMWVGTHQWQIGELSLLSHEFPALTLRQLNLNFENQFVEQFLKFGLQAQLQQFLVKQDNQGQGAFSVELRHLDVNHINQLRQTLAQFTRTANAQNNVLLIGKLLQQTVALLSAQPELVIPQLTFDSPHGQLTGNMSLGVEKVDAMTWLYPMALLESLRGDFSLDVPEALLKQLLAALLQPSMETGESEPKMNVQDLIAQWLEKGFMVQQGKTYHIQAKLQRGTLDLNGRQIAIKSWLR
jgi:uncharacterized protein YdgA (DUF945 family)